MKRASTLLTVLLAVLLGQPAAYAAASFAASSAGLVLDAPAPESIEPGSRFVEAEAADESADDSDDGPALRSFATPFVAGQRREPFRRSAWQQPPARWPSANRARAPPLA